MTATNQLPDFVDRCNRCTYHRSHVQFRASAKRPLLSKSFPTHASSLLFFSVLVCILTNLFILRDTSTKNTNIGRSCSTQRTQIRPETILRSSRLHSITSRGKRLNPATDPKSIAREYVFARIEQLTLLQISPRDTRREGQNDS